MLWSSEQLFILLNMSSAPPNDLTVRARIRDAAVAHFAADGFSATNLRAIAATVGVSAGLVIHHFGSKEKLREACDEHVLRVLTERTAAGADSAGLRDRLSTYMSDPEGYSMHLRYMMRAIADDAPAASTFVDSVVDESEAVIRAGIADGTMRDSSDPRALAVVSVLTSLAVLTMPAPMARSLGVDPGGPGAMRRLAIPTLELYTHGLYADDTMLSSTRSALTAYEQD